MYLIVLLLINIIIIFYDVNGLFVLNGFNFLNGEWSVPKYNTKEAENEIINMYKQTTNIKYNK